MAYHTLDELKAKLTDRSLIEATDDAVVGTIDEDITTSAAQSAADTIDGYLRSRYTLPLASVPGLLREISLSLAIYDLFRRRMPENMPESIRLERKNALALLEHIAEGKISLFEADKAGGFRTNKETEDRVFPKTVLDGY